MKPTSYFHPVFLIAIWMVTAGATFAQQPSAAKFDWNNPQFAYAKAYLYGLESERGSIIIKGKLDETVVNPDGIQMTPDQAQKLLDVMFRTQPEWMSDPSFCYEPHHGFVFYDAQDRVVAHFSPCLMCENYEVYPPVSMDDLCFSSLRMLIRELGLPVFSEDGESRDYAKKLREEAGK